MRNAAQLVRKQRNVSAAPDNGQLVPHDLRLHFEAVNPARHRAIDREPAFPKAPTKAACWWAWKKPRVRPEADFGSGRLWGVGRIGIQQASDLVRDHEPQGAVLPPLSHDEIRAPYRSGRPLRLLSILQGCGVRIVRGVCHSSPLRWLEK